MDDDYDAYDSDEEVQAEAEEEQDMQQEHEGRQTSVTLLIRQSRFSES